jgi:hypothetical protein
VYNLRLVALTQRRALCPNPVQRSRAGTVPITAYLPKEVRDRLKILAVRLDRTMNDLMAEALSDLFAKYGEPRLVPERH